MANKMETVIQHALRVFRKPARKLTDCLAEDLKEITELRLLANDISTKDVGKLGMLLNNGELKDIFRRKQTPLDYLPVYEDDNISIGVFLLKKGAKLPLHDHPEMYGIIKVLEGILKITSYSIIEMKTNTIMDNKSMFYKYPIKVLKHPEAVVTKDDQSCLLTPTERNLHEVECIEGPAAFLDILSPPYADGGNDLPRTCHYFEEFPLEKETDKNSKHLTLIQVPSPF